MCYYPQDTNCCFISPEINHYYSNLVSGVRPSTEHQNPQNFQPTDTTTLLLMYPNFKGLQKGITWLFALEVPFKNS